MKLFFLLLYTQLFTKFLDCVVGLLLEKKHRVVDTTWIDKKVDEYEKDLKALEDTIDNGEDVENGNRDFKKRISRSFNLRRSSEEAPLSDDNSISFIQKDDDTNEKKAYRKEKKILLEKLAKIKDMIAANNFNTTVAAVTGADKRLSSNSSIAKANLLMKLNKNSSSSPLSTLLSGILNEQSVDSNLQPITKSNHPPKISILMKENAYLAKTNINNKAYTFSKKCVKKAGFMALIQSFNNITKVLEAFPIYVQLNVHTLSLYKNTNPVTAFKSINLNDIAFITQKYRNTSCFEIKENLLDDLMLRKFLFSLCAANMLEMRAWIKSIFEFKECGLNLNVTKFNDLNGRMLADFQNVNFLTNKKKEVLRQEETNTELNRISLQQRLSELTYQAEPSKNSSIEDLGIQTELEKLQEFLRLVDIENNRATRQFQENLEAAEKVKNSVQKKRLEVEQVLEKEKEEERKKEVKAEQKIQKKQTVDFIKVVAEKIKKMAMSEIDKFKKQYELKIKEEKESANSNARKIMQSLQDQNKNQPYNSCINKKLKGFADIKYVKWICKEYYGEHGFDECIDKDSFCRLCCEHRVGIRYANNLYTCKESCFELVSASDTSPSTSSS